VTVTAPITRVSAGAANSLATLSDGGLLVWGDDSEGPPIGGNSDGTPIPVPTRSALTGVVQASAGGYFVLAVAHAVGVLVPNVIGEFRGPAVLELQGLGLTAHVILTADTPLCDNNNQVVAQSPFAGTVVTPGATVTIWVAKPPPGGCY
jgi:hypothetical protein